MLLVVVGTLTVLLTLQLFLMRAVLILKTRRKTRCLAHWEPVLIDTAANGPKPHPGQLAGADVLTFLTLWNHLQESLLGQAKAHLNVVAQTIGIPARARHMLRRGNLRQRLTAIVTLGQLRDREVWPDLCLLAAASHVPTSLAAARALIQIDRDASVEHLMPLVTARTDWPPARVTTLLTAIGADLVSEPLAWAALNASAEQSPRLIRYLDVIDAGTATAVVRQILRHSNDLEVMTACLRVLDDPDDLGFVRTLLDDPRWQVRVQAATAVSRLGTAEDAPRLKRLLADPEWWVRYRAAHGLCHLLADTVADLDRIQQTHYNPFARDVLAQARAERSLA